MADGLQKPTWGQRLRRAPANARKVFIDEPLQGLRDLDETLGGIRRGEIAYNDPRAVDAARGLAMGTMGAPGGGGVANIGAGEALKKMGGQAGRYLNKKRSYLDYFVEKYKFKNKDGLLSIPAAKDLARRKIRKNIKENIIPAVRNIPQEILDDVADMRFSADLPTRTRGQMVGAKKEVRINPIQSSYDTPMHEVTHRVQQKWGDRSAMAKYRGRDDKEAYRALRANIIRSAHEKIFTARKKIIDKGAAATPLEKDKNWSLYWKNPIEQDARVMAKWSRKFSARNERPPTKDEWYDRWDKQQAEILWQLKEKNPKLYKRIKDDFGGDLEHPQLFTVDDAMLKPELIRDSKAAMEWAAKAKPKDVAKLKRSIVRSKMAQHEHKKRGDWQAYMDEASRSNLMNDTLNAYLKSKSL